MERIKAIREHDNFWALKLVSGFQDVEHCLYVLSNSHGLTKEDEAYLEKVEREIKRLNPGKRMMFIDGQMQEVETLYLGSNGKDERT